MKKKKRTPISWTYADVGDKTNYAACTWENEGKDLVFRGWIKKSSVTDTVLKKTKKEIGL